MKVGKVALGAGIISIVAVASLTTAAFAWHPKGVITKKVQNVTMNGTLRDADTTAQAVAAKPGDTLKYVIEIRNDGKPDSKGHNDMAKTVMTDTLPAGVELVNNPSQRVITENIGLIKPGQKVTKEYLVKVTSKTDGSIKNTACFTGDSTVNDSPQKGCNPAVITVTVPEEPEVTTPTVPTPSKPTPVDMPVELPRTGVAENIFMSVVGLSLVTYGATRFVDSKRKLTQAQLDTH